MKVEIFYDSSVDTQTPSVVADLRKKHPTVDVILKDTDNEQTPHEYGIINPPTAVVDGKKIIQIERPDSLMNIVTKVIF